MPFSDSKIKPEIDKNAWSPYFTSWHQPWRSGRSPYWMP